MVRNNARRFCPRGDQSPNFLQIHIILFLYIKVTGCVCVFAVVQDLANRCSDRVLFYSEDLCKLKEGL